MTADASGACTAVQSCVTAAASLWHCVVVLKRRADAVTHARLNYTIFLLADGGTITVRGISVSLCWHIGKERRVQMLPHHLFLYRA